MRSKSLNGTDNKPPHHRFTDEEIDRFLVFLLEGGADMRCSNVYRIIEQQKHDILELRRVIEQAQMGYLPPKQSWQK